MIFLWGFTAILGKLVDLPPVELVLYRVMLAGAGLWVILRLRRISTRLSPSAALELLGTGLLLGLHWVLFFLSARLSHVSVCLVALATTALWTAILEPLMVRGRRIRIYEFGFGAIVLAGIGFIFQGDFTHGLGFAVGIGAALAGTLFSILNGRFAQRIHHQVISLYEMLGALLFCAASLPVSARFLSGGEGFDLRPSAVEWVWIALLAGVCTLYAYSTYVELLKRLSVYSINLAYNLEPVYGILLAVALFAEHEVLGARFFWGAAVILGAVLFHPVVERRSRGVRAI